MLLEEEGVLEVVVPERRQMTYLEEGFAWGYLGQNETTQITVKPLNTGHLLVLKNLSVIERCPLLGGNLKKIVTFGTKIFVLFSRHVRYLGYPLLGGFTLTKK